MATKKLFDHLNAITSEQDPNYFDKLSEEDLKSAIQNFERKGGSGITVYIYYTTGPVLVTQSYLDYGKNIHIAEPDTWENTSFGNYGKHHAVGSWKTMTTLTQSTMK